MPLNQNRLLKPVKKLNKLVNKIKGEPTPDEVHDLRTNTRRLEAVLEALSLDARDAGKSMVKNLSRFRKRAGKVRDMDVLTSYASTVHAKGEDECAVRLLEYLGARRQKLAKKLSAAVKQHRKTVRADLKRTPGHLTKTIRQNGNGRRGNIAVPTATAAAVNLAVQLAQPGHLGRDTLHPYRLKVKELRNVLQLAAGDSRDRFIEDLKQVKDAIGEWHDWEELVAIAPKALDHGNRCSLVAELKTIAQDKYNHALDLTEQLRKQYLRKPAPSGKRGSRAQPGVPRQAVWDAIVRLA